MPLSGAPYLPRGYLARYGEPVLQTEGRIADGASFHECDEVKDVAADATTSSCRTGSGMTRPRVLLGIDDEALPTAFRCVDRQGTAPTKIAAIKTVQHDAIMREGHLDRDGILDCLKVNPVFLHCSTHSWR